MRDLLAYLARARERTDPMTFYNLGFLRDWWRAWRAWRQRFGVPVTSERRMMFIDHEAREEFRR
jgi:hypothetical protein